MIESNLMLLAVLLFVVYNLLGLKISTISKWKFNSLSFICIHLWVREVYFNLYSLHGMILSFPWFFSFSKKIYNIIKKKESEGFDPIEAMELYRKEVIQQFLVGNDKNCNEFQFRT